MELVLTYGLKEINNVLYDIKDKLSTTNILAFVGPIGAGKTTFIKKLVHSYGFDEDEVNSPTFTYVNIYKTKKKVIYHFDLYRLSSEGEFLEMGFQEYLDDKNALIIIEWPEIIKDLLKARALLVEIDYIDQDKRHLLVKDF